MKKFIKDRLKSLLGKHDTERIIEILKNRGMKVGSNFNILEECMIDANHCWHIEIGHHVTLSPRVQILAHDASTKMFLDYTKIRNVRIGNYVFIGAGSIIMPGVAIGSNIIIGAASVVTKDIPDNSVYAGNPAVYKCSLDDYLQKQKELMNQDNMFGEEFTQKKNITEEMKQKMKHITGLYGTGFVK